MTKGKLLLLPITNPCEGRIVLAMDDSEGVQLDLGTIEGPYIVKGKHAIGGWLIRMEGVKNPLPYHAEELFGFVIDTPEGQFPLHPEQWFWARAMVNHELPVELETIPFMENSTIARIITATPVRSIEDIPEHLRHRYPPDFDFTKPPE